MLEASGGLIVASSIQVFLGLSGMIGLLMRFVGPLTITPTIALIGFSLADAIMQTSQHHWGVALLTAAVFIIVATVLNNCMIPFPSFTRDRGCHPVKFPIFKLFPQLFAIAVGWIVCAILTATGQLPDTPGELGYNARTDSKTKFIVERAWFFFPYPGQWGMPTFSIGIFFGMLAATCCSIIESVGDYCATARACGLHDPPKHAMNRGIAMEGLGSVFCGFLGTAHATTSYSSTIGFIPVTGMASRLTWQVAGVLLMATGIFGKVGAILSSIPDPVVGGAMLVGCGMVISIAMTNLQFVDMKSGRNLIILGTSLMMGMLIPMWAKSTEQAINTGKSEIDQALNMLLSTPMLIGGGTGCLLDNLIPGTQKERGFIDIKVEQDSDKDNAIKSSSDVQELDLYNLPCLNRIVGGSSKVPRCCTFIPFLPFYKSRSLSSCLKCCGGGSCCGRDCGDSRIGCRTCRAKV